LRVRIVTDSLSDLTSDLIGKLDITVVPLTVLFGHEKFLDRVTISTDEFYHKLIYGDIWPASAQPTPQEFADTYDELAENTDEILVINHSSKLSGTYQSAKKGKDYMKANKCRVEVIDSQTVAMGLGLVVILLFILIRLNTLPKGGASAKPKDSLVQSFQSSLF